MATVGAFPVSDHIPPRAIDGLQALGIDSKNSDDNDDHVRDRSPRFRLGLSETSLRGTQWCKLVSQLFRNSRGVAMLGHSQESPKEGSGTPNYLPPYRVPIAFLTTEEQR